MNVTPKGAEKPRRVQIEIASEAQGVEPDYQLPELDEEWHFVSILSEIGEGRVSGDRLVSIGWDDVLAWQEATGAEITPGEAQAVKYLSSCYVSQYYDSMESGAVAPHIESPANREQVANKLKSLFSMLRGE